MLVRIRERENGNFFLELFIYRKYLQVIYVHNDLTCVNASKNS
jgi:hypothetical protein